MSTENTKLLGSSGPHWSSERHWHSYRSTVDDASGTKEDDTTGNPQRSNHTFLVLLSILVVSLVYARSPLLAVVGDSTQGTKALSVHLVSLPVEAVTADGNDASTSGITLQELAQSIMPKWYQDTWKIAVPPLTQGVEPGSVYASRKMLLKTRDLIDVFSVLYPNKTQVVGSGKTTDIWAQIRKLLDVGYTVVGTFQDLDHAHINYTLEQLDASRNAVSQWRSDFEAYHAGRYDFILDYLRSPSGESFRHDNESRLFWKTMPDVVPSGKDDATRSLHILGLRQMAISITYLKTAYIFDSILGKDAHEHYHNLRKELRCISDEYDLFGATMFPNACSRAVGFLKKARGILGDINDHWTARDFYRSTEEFPEIQRQLAKEIDTAWKEFRYWVKEHDFENALRFCLASMQSEEQGVTVRLPSLQSRFIPPLQKFLVQRKKLPSIQFVIGNGAGDADTIISAITLAYIESMQGNADKTPIVAIDKAHFETQRPDVVFLLNLAGISPGTLLYVDDPVFEDAPVAELTLTDHNQMAPEFENRTNWSVIEIVDHHEDADQYLDTCSGDARTIAFADGKPLVASACTLVAEKLMEIWEPPYPASLTLLLMGVILLDSAGLSASIGRATPRDRDAVQNLLDGTDWEKMLDSSKRALSASPVPDPAALFSLLEAARYDPVFWHALSVRDALRLDFKLFSCGDDCKFGISLVLMPYESFLAKPNLADGILRYMLDSEVSFLAVMLMFEDGARARRQLAFCGNGQFPMSELIHYMMLSKAYKRESLDLVELPLVEFVGEQPDLRLRVFEQENTVPSRKQIGPLLESILSSFLQAGAI